MKTRLILLLINVGVLMGCAGPFKYHDPNIPHHGKDGFLNNYDNTPKASVLKWYWERWTTSFPPDEPGGAATVAVDLNALKNPEALQITWLGHSSMLVQMDGMNILTDPSLSERVSPFSFMGPKRFGKLPLEIEQLPKIDVVVISHSHYDHLDLASLRKINQQNQGQTRFLVPLGNKELLKGEDILNVEEYDWWSGEKIGPIQFTFAPAQHWTTRTTFDVNRTLWGGWMIKGATRQVYFVGDTGYSKDFQDIRQRLGAVDVALIPIGAYAPRWFMQKQHIDTTEAVLIHQDLGARFSLPLHWGTFKLSDEPMAEPPVKLKESLQNANLPLSVFPVLSRGETFSFEKASKQGK
ncbi:MBL fold metallo-hydrolase [Bdellovibrio sp. HCB274]|uniref:MBL fold metallo-hydrolase n=1 Tax=Bdellovibrio sp. HCB274 TaxID=3394361 RepID=UPI0039B4788D